MKKKYLKIIMYAILLIFIDQITKILVMNFLENEIVLINNFFSFLFVKNYGAAFGLFGGNVLLLIAITCGLIIYLAYDIKSNINNKLNVICSTLVLSGAIGNLIDRVIHGYVIDFISFTLFNKQMPVFNIADICVTFGVIGLIYIMFKEEKNERSNSKRRK